MGKPIEREFNQSKTILKYFDFKGSACVVPSTMGTVVGARKIVKAGTPYPTNDAECLGYILQDVDVTMGDAPGTYIYEGVIDTAKVADIEISATAKAATPKVTFFKESYKSAE